MVPGGQWGLGRWDVCGSAPTMSWWPIATMRPANTMQPTAMPSAPRVKLRGPGMGRRAAGVVSRASPLRLSSARLPSDPSAVNSSATIATTTPTTAGMRGWNPMISNGPLVASSVCTPYLPRHHRAGGVRVLVRVAWGGRVWCGDGGGSCVLQSVVTNILGRRMIWR